MQQQQPHLLLHQQLLLRRRMHVIARLSQLELQLLRTLAVKLCRPASKQVLV
jgi:hypothetical protein